MASFQQRFRTVVAMWIFVGLLGGPFFLLIGVAVLTAVGPFQPKGAVGRVVEFAPGAELTLRGSDGADVGPGNFMVLARPASVDPASVTCEAKSRVYTTGAQRTRSLEPEPVEGVEAVVTAHGSEAAYRTILTTAAGGSTAWMGIDYVTCDGEGVDAFAIADDESMSTGFRMAAGSVTIVFGLIATGLGFGALTLTRRWSRPPGPGDGPTLHPSMHSPGHPPGYGPHPQTAPGYRPHPQAAPGYVPQPHRKAPPGDPDNPFRAPHEPGR